eukprot:TRINITY_DN6538_c0_g1_i5.p2 TRINITY_DN6538_c0_g1~~TRINITY_DN6538_c0_g1_i5.p2  ORF type:complete len:136 (-),score=16.24 TRINITY_DN6538_c0_g1_i5:44-451(-)
MAEGSGNYGDLPVSVNDVQGLYRLFQSIDQRKEGFIQFMDYILFVAILKNPTPQELLRVSFTVMDQDGDGSITLEELIQALSGVNKFTNRSLQSTRTLAMDIFQQADINGDGRLTLNEILTASQADPTILSKFCL